MSKRGIELRANAKKTLPLQRWAPRTTPAKSEPAPAPAKRRPYNYRDLSNAPRIIENSEMMEWLIDAIKSSGKSVATLADETGITRENIYAIRRGKRQWCQGATFMLLAAMCGKSIPWK